MRFHHETVRAELLDQILHKFKMVPAKPIELYLLGDGDMPRDLEFRVLEPPDE